MTNLTPEALAEIHALVADIFDVPTAEVAAAPSKCTVPWSNWRGHAGHDPFNCRLVLAVEKVAAYRRSLPAATNAAPPCGTCGGIPPSSGKPCVCGGRNTVYAEVQGLRLELLQHPVRRLVDAEAEIARLHAALLDASGALSTWRTGRMADAAGHRFSCSNIEGTWACDKGCAVAERDKLRVENVELQNGLDGYARQLEARKAEIAERDALIGRLFKAVEDLVSPGKARGSGDAPGSHSGPWQVLAQATAILADPKLAPWRKK